MIDPATQRTLWKVVLPAVVILVVVLRARNREGGATAWLGLRRSPPLATALWLIAYAAWMLASNAVLHWRGPWDFTPWERAPLLISVTRVLAVGILGPIAEELLFRGFLYEIVCRRFGASAAIAATAVLWSVIHVQYSAGIVILILVDGMLLGLARSRTDSVVAPTLMHIVWNLFAVW